MQTALDLSPTPAPSVPAMAGYLSRARAHARARLELTNDGLHGIAMALDKVRSTSRTVTVDKDALGALLRDHGRLLALLAGDYADPSEN